MGLTATIASAVLGAGAVAYSADQQRKVAHQAQDQQAASAAQAEATKPQASQAPTTQAVQAGMTGAGQAGGAPGIAQTFLTGAQGVDPNSLAVGKNTLLGS